MSFRRRMGMFIVALAVAIPSAFAAPPTRARIPVYVAADTLDKSVKPPVRDAGETKWSVRVQAAVTHPETGLRVFGARELEASAEQVRGQIRGSDSLRLAVAGEDPSLILTLTESGQRDYLDSGASEHDDDPFLHVHVLGYRLELAGTTYVVEGSAGGEVSCKRAAKLLVDDIEEWVEGGIRVGNWLRKYNANGLSDSARDIVRSLAHSDSFEPVRSASEARVVLAVRGRRSLGYHIPLVQIEYGLAVTDTSYEAELVYAERNSRWYGVSDRLVLELESWAKENYEQLTSSQRLPTENFDPNETR